MKFIMMTPGKKEKRENGDWLPNVMEKTVGYYHW
jgi:hypothetical protein